MTEANPQVTFGNTQVGRNLLIDLTRLRPPFNDGTFAAPTPDNPLSQEWSELLSSPPSRTGYEAHLFATELNGERRYFVYHQATNDMLDMPSVTALANGKSPPQITEAQAFTEQAKAFIAATDPDHQSPIIQSGYSLGAALAILASEDNQPVIAFDPPATKGLLGGMGKDTPQTADRVLEILSPHPNMINAQGAHVGHTLIAGEKYWKNNAPTVEDFFTMTLHSHHAKNLAKGLQGMDSLPTMPAAERTDYPTEATDALREYLHDQVTKDSPFKSRMTKLAVDAAEFLHLDRVITKLVVRVADNIARQIHVNYAGKPLTSPPAVPLQIAEPAPAPAPDAPALAAEAATPAAQTSGFADRITAERTNAVQQGQGIA